MAASEPTKQDLINDQPAAELEKKVEEIEAEVADTISGGFGTSTGGEKGTGT
jgi:hypothetical protein